MEYIHYSSEPKPSVGFGGYGKMPIVWDENLNDGRPEKEIIRRLVAGLVNLIKWYRKFAPELTGHHPYSKLN